LPTSFEQENAAIELANKEVLADWTKTLQVQPLHYMKHIHTYRAGDHFGELALEGDIPRAARIVTATDCHFAVVERDDFRACLETIKLLFIE
jgi:CRP-like cAMP-binding protein